MDFENECSKVGPVTNLHHTHLLKVHGFQERVLQSWSSDQLAPCLLKRRKLTLVKVEFELRRGLNVLRRGAFLSFQVLFLSSDYSLPLSNALGIRICKKITKGMCVCEVQHMNPLYRNLWKWKPVTGGSSGHLPTAQAYEGPVWCV